MTLTEDRWTRPCASRFQCSTLVPRRMGGGKPLVCDDCRFKARQMHISKWNERRRKEAEARDLARFAAAAAVIPEPVVAVAQPIQPARVARYWSEDDGRFIECEVAWSGRGGMPHQSAVDLAWTKMRDLVLENAPSSAQLLTKADKDAIHRNGTAADVGPWSKSPMHGARCACGNAISRADAGKKYSRCRDCRRARREAAKQAAKVAA